ncbi:MAG: hypothetical protein ACOWWM_15955 [Desulfobacterales bacterium]
MKRMSAKQIDFEAGKIMGAKWKKREQTGTLAQQLQTIVDAGGLSEIDREAVEYLIESARELD